MNFGTNEFWSFELDFLNRSPDVKVFCFDSKSLKKISSRLLYERGCQGTDWAHSFFLASQPLMMLGDVWC